MNNGSMEIRRLSLLRYIVVIVLLLAMLPTTTAHADGPTPGEDQSFIAPGNASVDIPFCCGEVAQTFTAGMTGALTEVSIEVASSAQDIALHVSLHGVTNGLPDARVLGETWLWGVHPLSSAPITLHINIGTPYVVAGQQYALVVDYDNSGPAGVVGGSWIGATGDLYPGGSVYVGADNTFTSWAPAAAGLDLHFRTFVVPNVPVSDLSVKRIVGATHARACKVFSETWRVTNLGPDPAKRVVLYSGVTDQLDPYHADGTSGGASDPFDLQPGESRLVKMYFKVVAFVPGESREARVSATVSSDVYPDIAIDLNSANNWVENIVWMVAQPRTSCP